MFVNLLIQRWRKLLENQYNALVPTGRSAHWLLLKELDLKMEFCLILFICPGDHERTGMADQKEAHRQQASIVGTGLENNPI
jgi:hypothetical protein